MYCICIEKNMIAIRNNRHICLRENIKTELQKNINTSYDVLCICIETKSDRKSEM